MVVVYAFDTISQRLFSVGPTLVLWFLKDVWYDNSPGNMMVFEPSSKQKTFSYQLNICFKEMDVNFPLMIITSIV